MFAEDIPAAIDHGAETGPVEYKASFDLQSQADWLEIMKDIVAIANSGGGVIVFGVEDSGTICGVSSAIIDALDPADITNKLHKYTAQQFSSFRLTPVEKADHSVLALLIEPSMSPIVFSKPGTYDIGGGKQKTAFSAGTVYFRHGAKSEPGNSEDLRMFMERRIEEIRKVWFEGIVKVVEAPPGTEVKVVAKVQPDGAPVRLVNDPTAPAYYRVPIDETHPHRQKEVIEEVNKALAGSKKINTYNMQCVRFAHNIDAQPTFCYKQKFASARFSKAFVDWLIEQAQTDSTFFDSAKAKYDASRHNDSVKALAKGTF